MYHYVRDFPNTKYPAIKGLLTNQFRGQLAYLKKHYTFVTIEDCLNSLYNETNLPANACLLTFDDGYIDHFVTVFPILNENPLINDNSSLSSITSITLSFRLLLLTGFSHFSRFGYFR